MHDDEWLHRAARSTRPGPASPHRAWGVGALAALVALPALAAMPSFESPSADPCWRELQGKGVFRYAELGAPPATVLTLRPDGFWVNGTRLDTAPSDPGLHAALRAALARSQDEVRAVCGTGGRSFEHTLLVAADPETPAAVFLGALESARLAGFERYDLEPPFRTCGLSAD